MTSHLTVEELRRRLGDLNLASHGHKADLQKRLRKALKKVQPSESSSTGAQSTDSARIKDRTATQTLPDDEPQTSCLPKYRNYLVCDVEATCESDENGGGFDYPNEIIELPVILVRVSAECQSDASAGPWTAQVIDVFHSYVKPTFRSNLSDFCKTLTKISQHNVDTSPAFFEALSRLYSFLDRHDLLEPYSGEKQLAACTIGDPRHSPYHPIVYSRLRKDVIWVTHGPYDLCSFVPKSCWLNGLSFGPPRWLRGPILDIRKCVWGLLAVEKGEQKILDELITASQTNGRRLNLKGKAGPNGSASAPAKRDRPVFRDGSIPALLSELGLSEFQGQLHCGLDDTRNLARIVIEVIKRVAASGKPAEPDRPVPEDIVAQVSQLTLSSDCPGTTPSPPPYLPLLQPNVFVPDYPALPPPPSPPILPTDPAFLSTLTKHEQRLLSSSLAQHDGSKNVSTSAAAKGPGSNSNSSGSGSGSSSSSGYAFYPKRYNWMGKRVGMVRLKGGARWDWRVHGQEASKDADSSWD